MFMAHPPRFRKPVPPDNSTVFSRADLLIAPRGPGPGSQLLRIARKLGAPPPFCRAVAIHRGLTLLQKRGRSVGRLLGACCRSLRSGKLPTRKTLTLAQGHVS